MTSPTNTAGLEVVAWRWHHHTQPGLWSVTTDDSVLSDPYCVSEPLVTAASAQARIAELEALLERANSTATKALNRAEVIELQSTRRAQAAEARADRLAGALERIANGFPEVRAPHRVSAMRDFARAALQDQPE